MMSNRAAKVASMSDARFAVEWKSRSCTVGQKMDISIAGSAVSAAIKFRLSELSSFLTALNELTRRALLFVMRKTHCCSP